MTAEEMIRDYKMKHEPEYKSPVRSAFIPNKESNSNLILIALVFLGGFIIGLRKK